MGGGGIGGQGREKRVNREKKDKTFQLGQQDTAQERLKGGQLCQREDEHVTVREVIQEAKIRKAGSELEENKRGGDKGGEQQVQRNK